MAKGIKPQVKSAQFWNYKALKTHPHQILEKLVSSIRRDQSDRYLAYREFASMYKGGGHVLDRDTPFPGQDDLTINELGNTVETLHSQVFKNRVVPQPYCVASNFEQWEKAKLYGRWLDGVWDSAEVHAHAVPKTGMHTLVFGTGFLKASYEEIDDDRAKLCVEAVPAKRVFIDRIEEKSGNPRTVHIISPMDRYVAIQKFGKESDDSYGSAADRVKKLEEVKLDLDDDLAFETTSESDQIAVWESWHLPSSGDADDGVYVQWIRGATLAVYKWKNPRFPWTAITAYPALEGFYGDSLVRRLAPAQRAYDKMTQRIDLAHDLVGVPRFILRKGTGLSSSELDDVPGRVYECEGDPNTVLREWNPVPITPDAYRERDSLPNRMKGVAGVSGLESSMQLPQQLREFSGKAFEAYQDTSSARHAMLHRSYEHSMVDLADLLTMTAENLIERGISVVVNARTGFRQLEEVDFKEVMLMRGSYVLRVDPVSQLSKSLPSKIKDIKMLKDEGFLKSLSTATRLLEMPELEGEIDLGSSDEEIIMKNLQYMVRESKYLPPLPFDNHQLIIALTTRFINHYRVNAKDYDEDVVGMLSQYIDEAIALKNGLGQAGAQPAPQPLAQPPVGPAPQGMVPGAQPMVPPPEMGLPPGAGGPV